jgi:hypothetical protein
MDKKEAILHSSQGKDGVIVHHTYHYTWLWISSSKWSH